MTPNPLYPALPRPPQAGMALEQLGVEIVLCDGKGRPLRRRVLTLATCLGLIAPMACDSAAHRPGSAA